MLKSVDHLCELDGLYRDLFEFRNIRDKGHCSYDSSADSVQTLFLTNNLVRTLRSNIHPRPAIKLMSDTGLGSTTLSLNSDPASIQISAFPMKGHQIEQMSATGAPMATQTCGDSQCAVARLLRRRRPSASCAVRAAGASTEANPDADLLGTRVASWSPGDSPRAMPGQAVRGQRRPASS